VVKAENATTHLTSSSAIAERPRCRVRYSFRQVEDWNWETIFYGHSLSSTTVIGLKICRIPWKIRRI